MKWIMQFDAHQNIRLGTHAKSYKRHCSSGRWLHAPHSDQQHGATSGGKLFAVNTEEITARKFVQKFVAGKPSQFKFLNGKTYKTR